MNRCFRPEPGWQPEPDGQSVAGDPVARPARTRCRAYVFGIWISNNGKHPLFPRSVGGTT